MQRRSFAAKTQLCAMKRIGTLMDFAQPIPQAVLDIEQKNRSNLFAWRGQFSPQLIECLLQAYCPPDSVVLDPFAGSGTVLYEAAARSLAAFGFEINPSAWSFSKLYEFANLPRTSREAPVSELRARIEEEFPIIIFSNDEVPIGEVEDKIIRIGKSIATRRKSCAMRWSSSWIFAGTEYQTDWFKAGSVTWLT